MKEYLLLTLVFLLYAAVGLADELINGSVPEAVSLVVHEISDEISLLELRSNCPWVLEVKSGTATSDYSDAIITGPFTTPDIEDRIILNSSGYLAQGPRISTKGNQDTKGNSIFLRVVHTPNTTYKLTPASTRITVQ